MIVPLLILAAAFPPRTATGTSLAAIVLIALVGTIAYGVRDEVHFGYAALVGVPAAVGAVAGAALQQRLPVRTLTFALAALLAALGVALLL